MVGWCSMGTFNDPCDLMILQVGFLRTRGIFGLFLIKSRGSWLPNLMDSETTCFTIDLPLPNRFFTPGLKIFLWHLGIGSQISSAKAMIQEVEHHGTCKERGGDHWPKSPEGRRTIMAEHQGWSASQLDLLWHPILWDMFMQIYAYHGDMIWDEILWHNADSSSDIIGNMIWVCLKHGWYTLFYHPF